MYGGILYCQLTKWMMDDGIYSLNTRDPDSGEIQTPTRRPSDFNSCPYSVQHPTRHNLLGFNQFVCFGSALGLLWAVCNRLFSFLLTPSTAFLITPFPAHSQYKLPDFDSDSRRQACDEESIGRLTQWRRQL